MVDYLIILLNSLPTEVNLLLEFVVLLSVLLTFSYYFGQSGIYAFMILTMIVANLQVLKLVKYSFYPEPIALGKLMICFTFLSSDLLAECFGKKAAYKGVYLGFSANIGLTLFMLITVGYQPYETINGINFHDYLKAIFTPVPGIFLAGVLSFIISQFLDISIFLKLKLKWQGKWLPLRCFLATAIASFIDNIVFYTFAFYIFNPFVNLKTLIFSYIIGTYIFRLLIIAFSSSIISILKVVISKKHPHKFDLNTTVINQVI